MFSTIFNLNQILIFVYISVQKKAPRTSKKPADVAGGCAYKFVESGFIVVEFL